jgi:hypothetical protein
MQEQQLFCSDPDGSRLHLAILFMLPVAALLLCSVLVLSSRSCSDFGCDAVLHAGPRGPVGPRVSARRQQLLLPSYMKGVLVR